MRMAALHQDGNGTVDKQIDGLVQDCSISTALAIEILQSCTKPSKYRLQEFANILLSWNIVL